MGVPSPAVLALLGCGYARCHAGANFAFTAFYEVHPAFGGHIVCLRRKMVKAAPAQMANRLIKKGTTERRSNLSNGSSVRALSTASSATLASMAATDAIERKAS